VKDANNRLCQQNGARQHDTKEDNSVAIHVPLEPEPSRKERAAKVLLP